MKTCDAAYVVIVKVKWFRDTQTRKESIVRISIFGLGYVGTVCAGCFANQGHSVVGVDPIRTKVDLINSGRSPIIEDDINEIISDVVACGNLRATDNSMEAILSTDISFICVGTPGQRNGNLDLRYIQRVCKEIGIALKSKDNWHVVVIRSTVFPGTVRKMVIPILEQMSGRRAGMNFGVCHNPEFLREGSAVKDFNAPPKTVIGQLDLRSGERVAELYCSQSAPLIRTELEISEMVKYIDNGWHALKIGFANEIGNICDSLEVDPQAVMKIFCQDEKLNISPAYLKPGFAFGGSCLPKDLRAVSYHARMRDLELPILNSILSSNEVQIARGLQRVIESGNLRIGILGFSFKAGTDDLRESPMIEVIERLLGKGYDLRIYDHNVNIAALVGANRDFILTRIPHISRLMVESVEAVLNHAQTVVIGNKDPEFKKCVERLREDQCLVDLVRMTDSMTTNLQRVLYV